MVYLDLAKRLPLQKSIILQIYSFGKQSFVFSILFDRIIFSGHAD